MIELVSEKDVKEYIVELFNNDVKRIDYNKIFRKESEFVDWFRNNCYLLGCKILSESINGFPDTIIQKDKLTMLYSLILDLKQNR